MNCENKSVQTAPVLKIYAQQPLGSHLSLPLNTKQEHSTYAPPICNSAHLEFGRSSKHHQNDKLTGTILQQYGLAARKREKGRTAPNEIKA